MSCFRALLGGQSTTVFDKLTELIDALPDDDVTRANLIAVRGALRNGKAVEHRLHAVIAKFGREEMGMPPQTRH